MTFGKWLLAVFLLLANPAWADEFAIRCREHLPYGVTTGGNMSRVTDLCREGYALRHDDYRLVPLWASYRLNRLYALGCQTRRDTFAPDPALPQGRRAELNDYAGSGYDRGHMVPSGDMRRSVRVQQDSFYLSNMAPQLHGLNAGAWEALEERIRVYALDRDLTILVGPIFPANHVNRVNGIGIPSGFWKVVVDNTSAEALAFRFPHRPIPNGADLRQFLVSIQALEREIGLTLAVPAAADRRQVGRLWPAATDRFLSMRRQICG